jgi:Leucine-rich repeat (LRR) protein
MTTEHFTIITAKIIEAQQQKDYSALRKLAAILCSREELNALSDQKLFNFLLFRFHPDKIAQNAPNVENSKISEAVMENALQWANTVQIHSPEVFEFEDYLEEIHFDEGGDGYYINHEGQSSEDDEEFADEYYNSETIFDTGFLTAIKRKIYGRVDIDFPVHLLEDLEDVEVSGYDIDNLEGVEFCKQTQVFDFSLNQIFDLYPLTELSNITELYLSNNNITMLDALPRIPSLKVLDVAHNQLTDIEPLFYLPNLEFVNLSGNKINPLQKQKLRQKGVMVVG